MFRLIDLIYPRRCPLCGAILDFRKKDLYACPECVPKPFSYVAPMETAPDGKMPDKSEEEGEAPRKGEPKILKDIRVSFLYEGRLKDAVEAYKYEGMREYAIPFADWMLQEGRSQVEKWNIDVVSAVPLSKKRLKARGYNQAQLLADEIAKGLNKPYLETVLRSKDTRALKTLGKEKRVEELADAFMPLEELEKFRGMKLRVLLVDDILTTGATAGSVAKAILSKLPDALVFMWAFCQDLPDDREL